MGRVTGFPWPVNDTSLVTRSEVWGEVLVEIGRRDPRIVAVTADLGSSTKIGAFQRAFPDRFFDVGIAEQNMMAVAAGLAATGLVPVVCTYAAFAALRAAEFVRTDVAYNRRDVKIVGALAGVSFGQGGPTHHTLEDLALMRAIPTMTVVAPADGHAAGAALAAAIATPGPVYLRLGRSMEPLVYPTREVPLALGRAVEVHPGADVTVIACGPTVHEAIAAAERAGRGGVRVRVLDMHTLKPLDEPAVLRAAEETGRVLTVEDHSVIGGLGSAVADVLAASGRGVVFRKLGHQDVFPAMGLPEDLYPRAGIDEDGILAAIADVTGVRFATDEDWEDG